MNTPALVRHVLLLCATFCTNLFAADSAEQIEFFERKIRPVLVQRCYECHADEAKGGLRLDSKEASRAGGDSGPAIVPKDVDASLLLSAIKY